MISFLKQRGKEGREANSGPSGAAGRSRLGLRRDRPPATSGNGAEAGGRRADLGTGVGFLAPARGFRSLGHVLETLRSIGFSSARLGGTRWEKPGHFRKVAGTVPGGARVTPRRKGVSEPFSPLVILRRKKLETHTHTRTYTCVMSLYTITAKSQKSETFVCSFCRSLRVQMNYSARTREHRLLLRGRGSCPINAPIKRSSHVRLSPGGQRQLEDRQGISTFSKHKTKHKSLKIPVKKKLISHPSVLSSTHESKKAPYGNRSSGPRAKLFYCY